MTECTFLKKDFVPFIKITGHGFPIAKFDFDESKDKSEGKLLEVELYEVPEEQLPRLDSLEGHPTWYKRTPIKTESGVDVEIYDMWSQDFEDNSEPFRLGTSDKRFSWSN